MADSFTEVEYEGWGSRIMDSIKGVLVGIAMFFISFVVLFMNEGHYVATKKALEKGAGQVVSVKSDKVDSKNENKPIHTNGKANTDDELIDATFAVKAKAFKLSRTVEMYQWKETVETKREKKMGGKVKKTKHYTYQKVWSESAIPSGKFKKKKDDKGKPRVNPSSMPYQSKKWQAKTVTLGAFTLNTSQVGKIGGLVDLKVGGAVEAAVKPADPNTCGICKKKLKSAQGVAQHMKDKHKGQKPPAPAAGGGSSAGAPRGMTTLSSGTGYYKSYTGKSKEGSALVGDVRVTFKSAPTPQDCSVIAVQTGKTFKPFVVDGKDITQQSAGIQTKEEMFAAAAAANLAQLWILRIVGFLMMAIGLSMVFKPIEVVADVIPFLGNIVGMGFALAAIGISAFLSLFTIAIAWLFYRPLIGVPLLLLSVGILVALIMKAKGGAEKKAEGGGGEAPPAAA